MQRFAIFALLALGLASAVFAQCPNGCSNHGTCNPSTRVCNCQAGYQGTDCSIAVRDLPANQEYIGDVPLRGWNFFRFVATNGMPFTIDMTHGADQDADIYVRKGEIPDLGHYDLINVSTSPHSVLEVPATPGATNTYFIGVHGFSATHYTIKIIAQSSNCPNDCSRHGRCSGNNQCICNDGFAGLDCSKTIMEPPALLSWSSSLTIRSEDWMYYRFRVTGSMNFFRIEVQMTSGDVDIFVKFGGVPSLEDWDFVAASTDLNETLTVATPAAGDYYIGFYGFQSVTPFRFRIVAGAQQCPNKCSNHGNCNGLTCHCHPGYTGDTCNTLSRDLNQDETVQGHVDSNEWNYYQLLSNSGLSFTITVRHADDGDADCDVYVNPGTVPTRFRFVYRDVAPDAVSSLRVDNPGHQRWYIGIYGFSTCTYNMTITSDAGCGGSCGNNGRCVAGQCVCNAGWAGENCQIQAIAAAKGQSIHGNLTTNRWNYFTITTNSSSVHIIINEKAAVGALWLFVRVGGFPSLVNFDYNDVSLNNKQHKVSIHTVPTHQPVTFYIGVYGSPYVLPNSYSEYDMVAWYTPF